MGLAGAAELWIMECSRRLGAIMAEVVVAVKGNVPHVAGRG